MTDFDYSGLDLEVDYPINRKTCFALHDPEHEIPSRCWMPFNHVGPHKAFDWNGAIAKEWANEDAD